MRGEYGPSEGPARYRVDACNHRPRGTGARPPRAVRPKALWMSSSGRRRLLRGQRVAGHFHGVLDIVGGHPSLVVADLDGTPLEVRVRYLDARDPVQVRFDGDLAVVAGHALYTCRNRSRAAVSSSIFSSAPSPFSMDARTQCSTWSLSRMVATFSEAETTLPIWVSMSTQYASSSTMRWSPRTCPSICLRRFRSFSLSPSLMYPCAEASNGAALFASCISIPPDPTSPGVAAGR